MYDISNPSLPLRLVQGYLLEISYAENGLPHLSVDGVAGEETTETIRLFQQQNGLPQIPRPPSILDSSLTPI
jgi:peptidoglycan hydrolase-like protein with peptidoglycan-binding domain